MPIQEQLLKVQQSIRVPKDQNNDFAGFKYRSAEDILEKLKPILKEHSLVLLLTDSLNEVTGQAYIKATATLINAEGDSISTEAYAREEKTRPKMSDGQLTGAASSYSRKYALNGLLLLDDNKDLDSQNNSKKSQPSLANSPSQAHDKYATKKQWTLINDKLKEIGYNSKEHVLNYITEEYGITEPTKLSMADASMIISDLIGSDDESN